MKRIITAVLCAALCTFLLTVRCGYAFAETQVSAKACVLMCADTGEVILEKNSDVKLPMASTTKIMTAIIALEKCSVDDKTVEFTADMTAEGSSMYLQVGERIRLSELVKGLLAASGNDAANAIAISMCGTTEKFCKLMNERAALIGMYDTHFVTPSGLDDDDHYSTAYDMAVLMRYAMNNGMFRDIVSQKDIAVTFEKADKKTVTYHNHNRLLTDYEYCTGGKTGFTKKSGRCLVTCAEKDGLSLIAVTLNAPDDWNDHRMLYNYGFDNLRRGKCDSTHKSICIPVVGGSTDTLTVKAKDTVDYVYNINGIDSISAVYCYPQFLYAEIKKGEAIGKIKYYKNNKYIGEVGLFAESAVGRDEPQAGFFDGIKKWLASIFAKG